LPAPFFGPAPVVRFLAAALPGFSSRSSSSSSSSVSFVVSFVAFFSSTLVVVVAFLAGVANTDGDVAMGLTGGLLLVDDAGDDGVAGLAALDGLLGTLLAGELLPDDATG
jgi:hypothetical protein